MVSGLNGPNDVLHCGAVALERPQTTHALHSVELNIRLAEPIARAALPYKDALISRLRRPSKGRSGLYLLRGSEKNQPCLVVARQDLPLAHILESQWKAGFSGYSSSRRDGFVLGDSAVGPAAPNGKGGGERDD